MSKPRWFQLIEAHQQLRGKYGLTIPFLVGGSLVAINSRKAIAPPYPRTAVQELFVSILNEMPDEYVAYIHSCSDLGGQPVVALHNVGYSLPNPLESLQKKRATVFSEDIFIPATDYSIDTLVEQFASDFSADIATMNFSFRGQAYAPLTDSDFELIEISRSF